MRSKVYVSSFFILCALAPLRENSLWSIFSWCSDRFLCLTSKTLLFLIPAFPLAAVLITAAGGRRGLRQWCWLPTVAAIAMSFLASVLLLFQVQGQIDQAAARWH